MFHVEHRLPDSNRLSHVLLDVGGNVLTHQAAFSSPPFAEVVSPARTLWFLHRTQRDVGIDLHDRLTISNWLFNLLNACAIRLPEQGFSCKVSFFAMRPAGPAQGKSSQGSRTPRHKTRDRRNGRITPNLLS